MDHDIIYFSIPAYNVPKIKGFYENVFGWKFKQIDKKNDIWGIETSKTSKAKAPTIDGLLMKKMPTQKPMNYVHVESVDKYTKSVKDNGGSVYLNKMSIPGAGCIAIVGDPEGNPFALWETAKRKK